MPNDRASKGNEVHISTDGFVTVFGLNKVRIPELCGDLTRLHDIIAINRLPGRDKARLKDSLRIRHCEFIIINQTTGELIELPVEHVISLLDFVKKPINTRFVEDLLLQVLS